MTFFQQTDLRGKFVERLSQTEAAQQSVTRLITLITMNMVTLRAAAKLDLLFNKRNTEASLLNI